MSRWINSIIDNDSIIFTIPELGYKLHYKISQSVQADVFTEFEEDEYPDFNSSISLEFIKIEPLKNAKTRTEAAELLKTKNIISDEFEYDHIQIGFVYSNNTDINNHKWMINFMDVNNNYIVSYNATEISFDCPFTTTSWEDGNWHGRFVIYKKDVVELLEIDNGKYILKGKGHLGDQMVQPIEEDIDTISIRYNVNENMWYSDYKLNDKTVGSIPCKNIISDVPFVGKIDFSHQKPKVTAELKMSDVKGTSLALNALIIKRK
jgi:hypothetical protein